MRLVACSVRSCFEVLAILTDKKSELRCGVEDGSNSYEIQERSLTDRRPLLRSHFQLPPARLTLYPLVLVYLIRFICRSVAAALGGATVHRVGCYFGSSEQLAQ